MLDMKAESRLPFRNEATVYEATVYEATVYEATV